MITGGSCPHRIYRITRVSPCRHAATDDYAEALPGRVRAASTKSRRSSTAGWAGRGERDGKVYERNRCCYASSFCTSSNPVDVGWDAAHTRRGDWLGGELLVWVSSVRAGRSR
jgi:hypothetical protein